MKHTDTLGNPLPDSVFLSDSSDLGKIGQALATNTFLLVVKVSLEKGSEVVYDSSSKSATITDKEGFTTFVQH